MRCWNQQGEIDSTSFPESLNYTQLKEFHEHCIGSKGTRKLKIVIQARIPVDTRRRLSTGMEN